jgi:aminoglycoside/choline kinase family phosphotransferase
MSIATLDEMRGSLGVLYQAWAGQRASDILILPRAGSDRLYFRIGRPGPVVIGVYNHDRRENEAFVAFSRHFHAMGAPVPEVYAQDLDNGVYLQQDLGDLSLLQFLEQERRGGEFPESALRLYGQSLAALAKLQIEGAEGIDWSLCQPRPAFDRQSMAWDLSYFKYYFLKVAKVPFDEQALEDDFDSLCTFLLSTEHQGFMHRDFQARNIMVHEGKPYFIDFQGGRQGALQYDVASLLFQAKARIPAELRAALIEGYLDTVETYFPVDRDAFHVHFNGFLLIRTLQVLGSYGYRGLYERRAHFLESIPFALDHLQWLLDSGKMPAGLPHLTETLHAILESPAIRAFGRPPQQAPDLTVRIRSFSYRVGIPVDPSDNGGGFVFDCRAIHNPGRYPIYKSQTGRDQPVIDFLLQHSKVAGYLEHVYALVDASVVDYARRGFTDLMVSFGCTGGQHRSVYCADQLAQRIQKRFGAKVELIHIEQEKKNWKNTP